MTFRSLTLGMILLATTSQTGAVDLARHRWQHRPLLVFAPDAEHPAYRELASALASARAGLADRDMRIYRVLGDSVSLQGEPLATTPGQWRQRLEVPAGEYAVILIGKDGGVKLRGGEGTTLTDIFQLIDGMPMRRREMARDP